MNVDLDEHLAPTDIGGTTANTGYFWVGDCDAVTFIFRTAADYTDTACVCTVNQATSSTGAGATAIATLTGSLDAADEMGVFELQMEDMLVNTGRDYLSAVVTEAADNGVNYASIQVIKAKSRYKYHGMTTPDVYDSI